MYYVEIIMEWSKHKFFMFVFQKDNKLRILFSLVFEFDNHQLL